MAKGDRETVQKSIDTNYGNAQTGLQQAQGRNLYNTERFNQGYNQFVPSNLADYGSIMNDFRNFRNPGSAPTGTYSPPPGVMNINYGPYQGGNQGGTQGGMQQGGNQGRIQANPNQGPNQGPSQGPNQQQGQNVEAFIRNWQATNSAQGKTPQDLLNALQQAGYTGAKPFMYGNQPSGNEIDLSAYGLGDQGSGKYKIFSGEGANQGMYTGGDDSGGGNFTGNDFMGALSGALGGYGDFAKTGGFSPQDIQNMRAQMIAPIRGVYSRAQQNIERQQALQGGFSPNATAALAKTARDMAYSTADETTNANAEIGRMIQQGKLAGLGGLAQTGLGARGQNLQSLGQMANLYGTTPGQANMFGNQVLAAGNQDINLAELGNEIAKNRVNAQLAQTGIPSNFQQGMGNTAEGIGMGATIAMMLGGI